ncbi:MAG: RDD family protein [Oceanospirillaceae bacterium]
MNNNNIMQQVDYITASRWRRFWAGLIDASIAMAITIPLMNYLNVWDLAKEGSIPLGTSIKLFLFSWIIFFIIHGYLLKKYAQTVGKKLLGISIASLDGEKPDLWLLIVKRYLPVALVPNIPFVGSLLLIVDVLFIFRKDKRCIHDFIAGTKVVNFSANKARQSDLHT